MNSYTPRSDALRAKYPFSKSNFFDVLIEYQNLERLLIQECEDHFKNVETERELKTQKRQRIQELERENQQLFDGLKVCVKAAQDVIDEVEYFAGSSRDVRTSLSNAPSLFRNSLRPLKEALSHPAVQALKEKWFYERTHSMLHPHWLFNRANDQSV